MKVWATALLAGTTAVALAGCADMSGRRTATPIAAVAAPTTCVQTTIPIYFAEASDRLTSPALQALSAAASQMQGCRIREVVVVGLTQGEDTPANRQLSENRALQVTRALAAQNLPQPRIEAYSGTAAQGAQPLQRRTEVMIFPEGG